MAKFRPEKEEDEKKEMILDDDEFEEDSVVQKRFVKNLDKCWIRTSPSKKEFFNVV